MLLVGDVLEGLACPGADVLNEGFRVVGVEQ
jgi:hypothetical protein